MSITNQIRRWWHKRQAAARARECQVRGHADVACWSATGATGMECRRCKRVKWFGYGPGLAAHYYAVPSRPSVNLGDAS